MLAIALAASLGIGWRSPVRVQSTQRREHPGGAAATPLTTTGSQTGVFVPLIDRAGGMKRHLFGYDSPTLYWLIVVFACAIGVISIAHAKDRETPLACCPSPVWLPLP